MKTAWALAACVLLVAPVSASSLPDILGVPWPWNTLPDHAGRIAVVSNNDGNADTGAFKVDLYVDGSLWDTFEIANLESDVGWESVSSKLFTGSAGLHSFRAVFDPDNVVAESDETNNERLLWREFSLTQPDLAIESTEPSSSNWPFPQLHLPYRVCNVGDHQINMPAFVRAGIRNIVDEIRTGPGWYTSFGSANVPALAAGQCVEGAIEGDAQPGLGDYEYRLDVDMDEADPLPEQEFSNNAVESHVFVGPQAL